MPLACSLPCSDLAGPNCPCALGLAGECVYCTRLRGEDRCACRWAGACVLQAHPEVRVGAMPTRTRPVRLAEVLARSEPGPGVVDLRLAIPRRIEPLLRAPGSYVFLRSAGTDAAFSTPLTVVEAARGAMRLVFKVVGPKTRALAVVPRGGIVLWKGPYPGGLLGATALRHALRNGPGTAFVVARGMGQVVALPLVRLLRAKGWLVDACVDPRGTGGDFARAELELALGRAAGIASLGARAAAGEVLAMIRRCDGALAGNGAGAGSGGKPAAGRPARPRLLISCGTDPLHRWVVGLWRSAGDGWNLVATNNALMACGEGTCGACSLRLADGGRVRACKADVPPELLFAPAGHNATGRAWD